MIIAKRKPPARFRILLKGSLPLLFMIASVSISAETLQSFEAADGLYGYKDKKGQVRISARFAHAGEFNRYGFASVIEGSKPYFIDQKGKHVFQMFLFDNGPDYFKDGLARFVEKGKMGFFDERGRKVIPASFDFAFPFSGGTAEVCNGCKPQAMGEHFMMEGGVWMILDKRGKTSPHPQKGQKKDSPAKK